MKWLGILSTIVVLVVVGFLIQRNQSTLKGVSSYRIYYGRMDQTVLEQMKKYDMIIVEALHFTPEMVEELHLAGVKVIGYISASEVGRWDDEIIEVMYEDDWLKKSGRVVMNSHNKLGDLQSVHYRSILAGTIEKRIRNLGMDGVFFDTVDSIDVLDIQDDQTAQAFGYIKLLEDVRLRWEDAILIQNRGFNYIYLLERGMIDALLWENFSEDLMDKKAYKERGQMLQRQRWLKNIRPMVLAYRDEADSKQLAEKKRWLFSYLPGQEGLTDWMLD